MKLTALTLTKIEGDVIEEYVRHTLRFVDRIFIVDNVALDPTVEIVSALQDEGLPITTWTEEFVQDTADVMDGLARRVFAECPTDYLLVLDVDEFLRVGSRRVLELALANLPAGAHGEIPWVSYIPTRRDNLGEPLVLKRIRHRLISELSEYNKVIVSRSFMDRPNAKLTHGLHDVWDPDGPSAVFPLRGVSLAHFPVRSMDQLQRKALLGWSAFLARNYDEQNGVAYQWRRIYERLRHNPSWTEDDFFDAAINYLSVAPKSDEEADFVFDPLPAVECKYARPMPSWQDVAIAFTRQLALAYARLEAENSKLRAQVKG